jgi:hypothetical protein
MNTTPYPIKQPFGSEAMKYVQLYYYGAAGFDSTAADWAALVESEDGYYAKAGAAAAGVFGYGVSSEQFSSGRLRVDRTVQLLANLAAFEAWQQQWCDVQRMKQLLQVDGAPAGRGTPGSSSSSSTNISSSSSNRAAAAGSNGVAAGSAGDEAAAADARNVLSSAAAGIVSDAEVAWCQQHHLLPASLRHVQDTVNIIVSGAGRHGCATNPVAEPQSVKAQSDSLQPLQINVSCRRSVYCAPGCSL